MANESGQYSWHDHRIHYMGRGTPPRSTDEDERTKIFDYEVPLEVGGQQVRSPGPSTGSAEDDGFPAAPFIALGAVALIVCAPAVLVIRRRRRAAPSRR